REGREGVAAPRRLETDEAAARCGRADRAEAVGGVRHREHARADRGRGPAARARRDARRVPRVARGTVEARLAGEREAELAGVGASEDDEPRTPQALDVLAVGGGGRRVGEELRAARHPDARDGSREVLHEVGHTAERAIGQAVGDRLAPVVVELHHHRIDRGVPGLDPLDRGLEELSRLDLATAHEVGELQRVVLLVVSECAHLVPSRMPIVPSARAGRRIQICACGRMSALTRGCRARRREGMAIEDWPAGERPRERLCWNGPEALADAELLAIQLGSGTRGKSAVDVAREMLAAYGSLAGIAGRDVTE